MHRFAGLSLALSICTLVALVAAGCGSRSTLDYTFGDGGPTPEGSPARGLRRRRLLRQRDLRDVLGRLRRLQDVRRPHVRVDRELQLLPGGLRRLRDVRRRLLQRRRDLRELRGRLRRVPVVRRRQVRGPEGGLLLVPGGLRQVRRLRRRHCTPPETCASCEADCGECSVCGNGKCEGPYETCVNCPADCGECTTKDCLAVIECLIPCFGGGFSGGQIPPDIYSCVVTCSGQGCPQANSLIDNAVSCILSNINQLQSAQPLVLAEGVRPGAQRLPGLELQVIVTRRARGGCRSPASVRAAGRSSGSSRAGARAARSRSRRAAPSARS